MRPRPLALALALIGCIAPSTPSAEAPSCEHPAIGTTGPRLVHVELASTMPRAACVTVWLDGVMVAAKGLPAQTPGLHANPSPAGDVRWSGQSVLVRIQDPSTGRGHEERVALGAETWVVGWLGEDGGNIETYDQAPMWM